ncbi:MAG TPA: PIG-L family deacetylase [Acidimicrobiales bacterium]|nr:PIG-L family deacetylase [Acidimicrobiales bacterium]
MTRATTDTNPPRRLLGVWSHPDDEAYLAAGLMARTVDAGGSVTLLTITDGEAGFAEDDPRTAPERAKQRRAELRSAMAVIGVADIRRLGVADGGVDAVPDQFLVSRIVEVIREVRPDAIVTFGPDGVTGHPDHVATARVVTRAWLEAMTGELWYAAKTEAWLDEWRQLHDEFGVWMTEEPTGVAEADLERLVDLAGVDLARKRAVLAAHTSQTEGLSAAFGETEYLRWIAQEAFRRPTGSEMLDAHPAAFVADHVRVGSRRSREVS